MLKTTIRAYRQKQRFTQKELAEKTGLSVLTIFRYEAGEREPRASDIRKLCEALSITEDELLNGPRINGFEVILKGISENLSKSEKNRLKYIKELI